MQCSKKVGFTQHHFCRFTKGTTFGQMNSNTLHNHYRFNSKSGAGFTLIEMIVYMALFSVMMGGLVVTMYYLYQSIGRTSANATAQEEINFVLKKIDWALTGASSVEVLEEAARIRITKTGSLPNLIGIKFNSASSSIEIRTDDTVLWSPLTSGNVKVSGLEFQYTSATRIVTASTTISGSPAVITKYLR